MYWKDGETQIGIFDVYRNQKVFLIRGGNDRLWVRHSKLWRSKMGQLRLETEEVVVKLEIKERV